MAHDEKTAYLLSREMRQLFKRRSISFELMVASANQLFSPPALSLSHSLSLSLSLLLSPPPSLCRILSHYHSASSLNAATQTTQVNGLMYLTSAQFMAAVHTYAESHQATNDGIT